MWFVYVVCGLILLIICGIYVRRRFATALAHFGVSARRIRIIRWLIGWLLWGFPTLVIVSIFASRLLGSATMPRYDGLLAAWLMAVPFVWAMLVVLQSVLWVIAIDLAAFVVRRRRDAATAARMRAVAVLIVVGGFAVYTPARILAERGELRVRHFALGEPGKPPAATKAADGFRIAFLADIQQDVHTDAERAREVYAIVNASQPDIVLSGGDWINTGPDYIERAAATAEQLRSRLGTFSVRGDHEHFAYADRQRSVNEVERAMRAHGIFMASNEVRWFDHCGKRIAVVLLNYNYIYRTDETAIASLIASVAGADYSIVVTHQLDRKLSALLDSKVDLVLAGHTHGGQVNPVVGLVHVPLARLETELVDGRYQLGSTAVIVTAGVGYSIVPLRYASPGSIEIIDLAVCQSTGR